MITYFTEGGNCMMTLTGRTSLREPAWHFNPGFGAHVVVHDSIVHAVFKYDYARAERAIVRAQARLYGVAVTFADVRRRPRRVAKKLKARGWIRQHSAAQFVWTELSR